MTQRKWKRLGISLYKPQQRQGSLARYHDSALSELESEIPIYGEDVPPW
jgi:hypothetical protein